MKRIGTLLLLNVLIVAGSGFAPLRIHSAVHAQAGAVQIEYPAGWNLIAGAGLPIAGADGPIYTVQSGDQAYEAIASDAPLQTGLGYWVYFDRPSTVRYPDSGTIQPIPLPPGQWVMVGRPPFAGPEARGADLLYVYEPAAGRYRPATSLEPGQGAWALSSAGGSFSLTYPGAPAR